MTGLHDQETLARQVLTQYALPVGTVELLQSGEAKTVWRITAGGHRFALKQTPLPPERVAFTVSAQLFLRARGMRVPRTVPTASGEHYVRRGSYSFVMYEYVEGRHPHWRSGADLSLSAATLGEFHRLSQGCPAYPPGGAVSKAARWPHLYARKRARLARWRDIAAADPRHPLNQAFLIHIDTAIHLASTASNLLAASPYSRLAVDCQTLSHQDYGEHNIILAPDGPYVIDLDGLAFDLPTRDLRKLINKAVHLWARWDTTLLRRLLSCYERQFFPSEEMRQLLLIDLLFPHLFHDVAKNPYEKRKAVRPARLIQAGRLEESKIRALEFLFPGTRGKADEGA